MLLISRETDEENRNISADGTDTWCPQDMQRTEQQPVGICRYTWQWGHLHIVNCIRSTRPDPQTFLVPVDCCEGMPVTSRKKQPLAHFLNTCF